MKVLDVFILIVEKICAVLMAIMTAVTFAQAFARYVLNHSIYWAEESAIFCMIFITFFGALIALKRENHTRIDFVLMKFPPHIRKWVEVFNYLLITAFLCYVCYKAYPVIQTQARFRTPGTHMRRSMYTIPIMVNGILMIIYSVFLAVKKAMQPVNKGHEDEGV